MSDKPEVSQQTVERVAIALYNAAECDGTPYDSAENESIRGFYRDQARAALGALPQPIGYTAVTRYLDGPLDEWWLPRKTTTRRGTVELADDLSRVFEAFDCEGLARTVALIPIDTADTSTGVRGES